MNIVGKIKLWYTISTLLIIASIVSLVVFGLHLGADFQGGTLLEIGFNQAVNARDVEEALSELNLPSLQVSETDNNGVIIKTAPIDGGVVTQIQGVLKEKIGNNVDGSIEERQVQTIGATVGKDLTKKAIIATIIAIIAISIYIAWSFRKVQKPFTSLSMSVATVIALAHDVIITLGFVSVINHFYGYEANSYLLVALLTILGFSVHDSIVVLDRVRENLLHTSSKMSVKDIVNESIQQTIARSLNTSLTAILVLLALSTIGSGSIRPFALTLLAGIAFGTYSSIFIASMILVTWDSMKNRTKNNVVAAK